MDLQQLAKLAFDAATSGALSWPNLAAVAAMVAVVGLLRLVLAPKVPFFGTAEGGLLLNVLVAGLGAAATAICGGAAFSWALLGGALLMSWKAAGGWALLKNVWPLLLKLPFIAALFPPRADGPALVTSAQKAGLAAAVVAKAPTPDEIANGKP